ncbi:zinc ion binding protein [Aureococcus anophagefferens]|uniref:Zinc ion binding protein n=1 Tax=Aureococcus anophagefferens TaxID=44056 RepID=A0ABR1FW86_AURAN
MSSKIQFRFQSSKAFDAITFSGLMIKLLELKRAIVEKLKLDRAHMDFDLAATRVADRLRAAGRWQRRWGMDASDVAAMTRDAPAHYLCRISEKLLDDAMMLPCCGESVS